MINFKQNEPLKNHSTFRIGGLARYFVVVKNKEEILEAVNFAEEKKIKYFVFGHTHDFENSTLKNGSVYLNLGTWLRQYHKVNSDFKPVRNLKYILFFEEKEKSDSDFEIKQREIH